MCGFAGFYGPPHFNASKLEQVARSMADAIIHRGPDMGGVWVDPSQGIALGHRRLSILDLSSAGQQPMASASGRYIVVFNGEIYNHMDVRRVLDRAGQAPVWRGHSDTETLLGAFEAWGIEASLQRCVGMFALAIWDNSHCSLTLARDRLGEKPLYYGWNAGVLMFASELKALKRHPAFSGTIDRDALASFMRYRYVPAPLSIYSGIGKLPPGMLLKVQGGNAERQGAPRAYWSFSEVIQNAISKPWRGSDEDMLVELEERLKGAIRQQMVADVPLGAFLSGGIDSSTIVALMQSQSSRRIKTFTIGFDAAGYDEAGHAKAVARHLGTDHSEHYVTPDEALSVIPQLPLIYDEPFADASQIPTYLVARMARQHVTVSLSGDGGDELFGGYNRYHLTQRTWGMLSRFPVATRRLAAGALNMLSPSTWESILDPFQKLAPVSMQHANIGEKVRKGAMVLPAADNQHLYELLMVHWPEMVVLGATKIQPQPRKVPAGLTSLVEQMMALDTVGYLPDDVLCKVDRAAMAVSLETRMPFLDHRLLEFAWSLPLEIKVRNNTGKWALRQLLHRHVPMQLVERPKMGFTVPLDHWLRGPLKDWAAALIDESRLRQEGFLDSCLIQRAWKEHLSGVRNWQDKLWVVLMFQSWLEEQAR